MSEKNKTGRSRLRRIRHTGRIDQVFIYLGKQLRFFINQSDWKVLPMAAIIAGLVGMVIRRRFFVNMEGSLIGAFALTCVALWNGCFNSIQSVCRERPIVKREHRSGMHISAYVTAHMIYQFMLCAAQTALTMFVLRQLSVPIPRGYGSGLITPWMICDIGIIMFLISVIILIAGVFMETSSAIIILTPVFLPLIESLGVSTLHFGILFVVGIAIGMITPPVAINLFVATGITGLPIEKIAKAVLPYLVGLIAVFLLIVFVPLLVPGLM